MEILVCVKRVPAVSEVKIDRVTNNLIREGVPSIINPPDRHALEQALLLREQFGGSVTVLTMGAPDAKETLQECIAIGADRAYLVCDRACAGSDTLATGYILATAIKHLGNFEVVLTGTQAIDGDTGQVGPEVAELLDYAQITYVNNLEATEKSIIAIRDTAGGMEKVEVSYPALLSISRKASTPRTPSDEALEKSKAAEVTMLSAEDIHLDVNRSGKNGSATIVHNVFPPALLEKGFVIAEETEEASVEKLMHILLNEKLIG